MLHSAGQARSALRRGLPLLTLALCAACQGAGASSPQTPEGPFAGAVSHRAASQRVAGQGIDAVVHRLARALDLDAGQQRELRRILLDQHREVLQLRSAGAASATDRASATLAILDRTRERIRATLNEDQRRRYSAEVPREAVAPAQADLAHWMQLREAQPTDTATQAGGAP